LPARIRLNSTTSQVGWRATGRFVREVFKRQGFRLGLSVLVTTMVREPLTYAIPAWVRRHWTVIAFGAFFACLAVVLVLRTISPAKLAALAGDADPAEKLNLARFVVAVLTFALAWVGSFIALAQILKALARPDLYPTFCDGSTYYWTPFEMPLASGESPWIEVPVYLRNVSRVAANHAKLTLTFENSEPFVIKMYASSGMPDPSWQPTSDTERVRWEFRSLERFRVYGEDDFLIGRLHLSLPPHTMAPDLGWDLPKQHEIRILSVVHDDWARRQRPMLWLTIEAR
jgi:hypothetical protein